MFNKITSLTKFLVLLSLLFSFDSQGQCSSESDMCVNTEEWQFAVAFGAGTLTNPLHGGKNIPLVLVPQIYYYDERFYIENNVIGYSFYQSEQLVVSAISQLNRENAFFTEWRPTHLLLPSFSESIASTPEGKDVEVSEVKKRKWAVDGGIQLNWFISDSIDIEAQILHDLNKAYSGLNGHIGIHKQFSNSLIPNTHLTLSGGINWLSASLVNYYYGLDESDGVDNLNFYRASSALQPYLSFSVKYKINNDWHISGYLKKELLNDNVVNSPLVNNNHITTAFIGVVYAF